MKQGKFTEEEISIIKAKYADIRTADLAKELNRKVRSLYGIAFKLGLEKSEAFKQSELSGRVLNGKRGLKKLWLHVSKKATSPTTTDLLDLNEQAKAIWRLK